MSPARPCLLDHPVVGFTAHDLLDGEVDVRIVGRDDEAVRMLAHRLVVAERNGHDGGAGDVRALADEAADVRGRSGRSGVELLVELPEDALVPGRTLGRVRRGHRRILITSSSSARRGPELSAHRGPGRASAARARATRARRALRSVAAICSRRRPRSSPAARARARSCPPDPPGRTGCTAAPRAAPRDAPANSLSTSAPASADGGLGGDELLRDEVHAVAERRDEADVREPVVGEQQLRRDAAVQVVDGHLLARLREAPVDPSDELLDRVARSSSYSRISPRLGTAIWTQRELAARVRPMLEQQLERAEPLGNALRVVEPVDAEQHPLSLEVPPQPRELARRQRAPTALRPERRPRRSRSG